jgi:hypothetical protein
MRVAVMAVAVAVCLLAGLSTTAVSVVLDYGREGRPSKQLTLDAPVTLAPRGWCLMPLTAIFASSVWIIKRSRRVVAICTVAQCAPAIDVQCSPAHLRRFGHGDGDRLAKWMHSE